jgi:hypothetical protein
MKHDTTARSLPNSLRWAWIALAVTALAGLALWRWLSVDPAGAGYLPDEVVYAQPLHGVYETGSKLTSIAFLPPDVPQPAIELLDDFKHIGRVRVGDHVQHTFAIRNTGRAPLTVMRLYTTCDYLTADLSASVIPPGRVALLVLTFDPNPPDIDHGLVRRGAILESNDPRRPETTVWVQAFIVP